MSRPMRGLRLRVPYQGREASGESGSAAGFLASGADPNGGRLTDGDLDQVDDGARLRYRDRVGGPDLLDCARSRALGHEALGVGVIMRSLVATIDQRCQVSDASGCRDSAPPPRGARPRPLKCCVTLITRHLGRGRRIGALPLLVREWVDNLRARGDRPLVDRTHVDREVRVHARLIAGPSASRKSAKCVGAASGEGATSAGLQPDSTWRFARPV